MKTFSKKTIVHLHPEILIYAQLILCCFEYFNDFNISTRYNDFITIAIFICCVIKGKKEKTYPVKFVAISFIYILVALIVYEFNDYPIKAYLWGAREIITSLIFMWGCIKLLEKKDIIKLVKLFYIIFIFNFFMILYQYFRLGLIGDSASGIFGTTIGNNEFQVIFLLLATICTLTLYVNMKIKLKYCILCLSICLIISAISELKVYFLLLIFIIILQFILMKFNKKTVLIAMGSLILLLLFTQLLYKVHPGYLDLFSIQKLLSYSGGNGYTSKGDVNRLTGLHSVVRYINYRTSTLLFGIGLGNGQYILVKGYHINIMSRFYSEYGNFLHYTWFTQTLVFVETGVVGFLLYIARYIALFIEYIIMTKKNKRIRMYSTIGEMTVLISIFLIFYDSVMQTEIGIYFSYFLLSVPFVLQNHYSIENKNN
ncbi:hypothetical protein [Clostridium psychrophilum]|uniref:hypothetical protein n=1 Tax=Clostridium psychrophilum TaxID=132926 RepID=UPI001C0E0D44|nr:hypothetical protein [Clostridium psychrophilum]MBU3180686.1 hypothetical protein [Clostridium psychrophilum]